MSKTLPTTFVPGFHDENVVNLLEFRQLGSTDMVVSSLSFGASSLGGVFKVTDDRESESLVDHVIRSGINYIDTAPWYGQGRSESVVGRALKNIPRKAYYIATKVGRYEQDVGNMFDFSVARTKISVEESLDRLQLEYVDLIQIHDIEFSSSLEQIVNYTLPALMDLQKAGKVRYIGLTSYSLDVLMRAVELAPPNSIHTVLTYCRSTLLDQALLGDPLGFFQSHGVGVINASPVAMGLLSSRGPPAWHPAINTIKYASRRAVDYSAQHDQDITELAVLWTLDQTDIPTTLISTASRKNLENNIRWATKRLSGDQKEFLQKLERKFFRPMTVRNWENVEVNNYWQQMDREGLHQTTDIHTE